MAVACRLREAESTVQKRLQWARQQVAAAAKPGLFNGTIQQSSLEAVLVAIKEAISVLSPLIRNRLRGLPAYVLDYADLIPSNTVERADLKPVLLAGELLGLWQTWPQASAGVLKGSCWTLSGARLWMVMACKAWLACLLLQLQIS